MSMAISSSGNSVECLKLDLVIEAEGEMRNGTTSTSGVQSDHLMLLLLGLIALSYDDSEGSKG